MQGEGCGKDVCTAGHRDRRTDGYRGNLLAKRDVWQAVGGTGGAGARGLGLIAWVPLHVGSQASRTCSSSGVGWPQRGWESLFHLPLLILELGLNG